jgi:hypothetical protein
VDRIELLHKDVRALLKTQRAVTVSTVDESFVSKDGEVYSHSDARKNLDTAWLNNHVFNQEKIQKSTLAAAVEIMSRDATRGMIVKCACVSDCIQVANILKKDFDLKARSVVGDMKSDDVEKSTYSSFV